MTRVRVGNHLKWTTWMCFETYAEAEAHRGEGNTVVRFGSSEWFALLQNRMIITTNYGSEEEVPRPRELMHIPILLKPFGKVELHAALPKLLEKPNCSRHRRRKT